MSLINGSLVFFSIFLVDMTQSTADLVVMMVLEKSSIKDVKMDELHKLKKIFSLSLLGGKDKPTHVRATCIANALSTDGCICRNQ